MTKEEKYHKPKWVKRVLLVTLIIYIWFLISTLLLPLAEFVNITETVSLTIYKLIDFPIAILGFVVCISLFSTLTILFEFRRESTLSKLFLIGGFTFTLYFAIPLIATAFLLVLIASQLTGNIPTGIQISTFLGDLFIFTSILFVLTAILNIATQKFLESGGCCPTIDKEKNKQ